MALAVVTMVPMPGKVLPGAWQAAQVVDTLLWSIVQPAKDGADQLWQVPHWVPPLTAMWPAGWPGAEIRGKTAAVLPWQLVQVALGWDTVCGLTPPVAMAKPPGLVLVWQVLQSWVPVARCPGD